MQWGSKQEDSQTLRGARRRRYACRRKATCLWTAVLLPLPHCLLSVPSFYLSLVSLFCSLFLPTSVSSHFLSDKFLFSVLLSVLCSLFLPISVSGRFLSEKCLFVFLSFLHFCLHLCLRGSTLCPLHFGLCFSFRCLSMALSRLCSLFLPTSLSLPAFYFALSVCICSLCLSCSVSLYVLPFPLDDLFLFVASLCLMLGGKEFRRDCESTYNKSLAYNISATSNLVYGISVTPNIYLDA